MGFDGVDILDCLERRPTTVFYPAHDIGERAAEMLYELIQGREQPMEQLLDCPLLPGETV
ncbi:MAG: LacI family transcriptional regulator, partial [Clostridiales bacterium]|nr:LacI family transcriptional regulator [Clostridiales bacterium]